MFSINDDNIEFVKINAFENRLLAFGELVAKIVQN